MQELLDNLRRPVWWFSVIIAGLAVNLASAYLKGPLDRTLAARSEARRRRLEAQASEFSQAVARWAKRSDSAIILRLEKLEHIQEQRVLLLWALLGGLFSLRFSASGWHVTAVVFSLAALLCTVLSTWHHERAAKVGEVLRAVEKDLAAGVVGGAA